MVREARDMQCNDAIHTSCHSSTYTQTRDKQRRRAPQDHDSVLVLQSLQYVRYCSCASPTLTYDLHGVASAALAHTRANRLFVDRNTMTALLLRFTNNVSRIRRTRSAHPSATKLLLRGARKSERESQSVSQHFPDPRERTQTRFSRDLRSIFGIACGL